MKRILSFLLAALLFFSVPTMAIPVSAASNVSVSLWGTSAVGYDLTTALAWTGSTFPKVTAYQWQRSSDGISGWTAIPLLNPVEQRYTLTFAELNKYIRVVVSFSDGGTEYSPVSPKITLGVPLAGVTITGTPEIDEVLTANVTYSGWTSNIGTQNLHYQWQRSTDYENWTNISAPADRIYTLTTSDAGCYIRVVVTPNDTFYVSGIATSLATTKLAPPSPTVDLVAVSPNTASIQKGLTQQFTATVTGSNAPPQTVIWSHNGDSAETKISADGVLSVGADEYQSVITVTATSTADTSKSGTATVTVKNAPTVSYIGLNMYYPSLPRGGTLEFSATVNGMWDPPQTVTWSVTGNADPGTTISANGVLSVAANETSASLSVTATSTYDTIVSQSTPVTVLILSVSSVWVSWVDSNYFVTRGTTQGFYATVLGSNDPDDTVTWSVEDNKNPGTTISAAGILSVALGETADTIIVRATSSVDTSKSGTTTVYLMDPPSTVSDVSVEPGNVTVQKGATQMFNATVNGQFNPSQDVAWSVSGKKSDDTMMIGSLLWVASDETAAKLTVTAVSSQDISKSGAATVIVASAPVAPGINGPKNMTLEPGYKAISSEVFTISGSYPVMVTKVSGDAKITYNAIINTLDIAEGLSNGTYPVTLKATNGTLPDATFTFTLTVTDADTPKYAVTVVGGTADKSTAAAGTTITVTAGAAPADKVFDKWTTASGVTFAKANNEVTTFTMPSGPITVTATYKDAPAPTYSVTVKSGKANKAVAAASETITITADAAPNGKVFDKWTTASGADFASTNSEVTTFVMPAKAVTVTATYKDAPIKEQKIEIINGTTLFVNDSFLFFANETNASTFLSQIKTSGVKLYGADGKELDGGSLVGTGAILKLEQNGTLLDSYTIFMLGDLDGNGKVEASDARTALRISAKLESPTNVQILAANTDRDGQVTASDARSILRVSAKLDNPNAWLGN